MKLRNIDGVVLAAGYSSRIGLFKPELDIGGISMVERTVLNMKKFCDKVFVVGGYKVERVSLLLNDYESVELVYNKNFQKGMFTSVKVGLKNTFSKRVFVQLADIPFVSESVYNLLIENKGDILIPTYRGRKGHPVLIDGKIIKRILKENDDAKLNEIFGNYGYKTVEVAEDTIFKDIDTVEDIEKYKEYFNVGL